MDRIWSPKSMPRNTWGVKRLQEVLRAQVSCCLVKRSSCIRRWRRLTGSQHQGSLPAGGSIDFLRRELEQTLRHQVEESNVDSRTLILKGLCDCVDWTEWPAYYKPRDLSIRNILQFGFKAWGTSRGNRFRGKFCYHP